MIVLLLSIFFLSVSAQSVCGYDGLEYTSKDSAHANNTGVMHCGNCGKCSNMHDIDIYKRMAETLTGQTTYCSVLSIFGMGRKCMRKHVGFTPECLDCWMENIMCTRKHCALLCIMPAILGKESESNNGTTLNKCLQCDEDKCGPAFKRCAGANRRRCGIGTDIARPDDQLCKVIDPMPKYFTAGDQYNQYDQYDQYDQYEGQRIELI